MTDISKAPEGKMSGGHILARALKDKGIEKVFSLCGGFINPIFIGLSDYGIDVISCRSEMEAGFLATATARLTRDVAVCIAEPSGFTNYISAVAEAYYAGDPVIFIGISSNTNNFDNKGFKEMPQSEVVACMTKYSIEVSEPSRIAWFLDKAHDIAINQPMGPVQLTIPTNFLFTKQIDSETAPGVRAFDPARKKTHQPYPDPKDLEMVISVLSKAHRPAIIVGPGVWYSEAEYDLETFSTNSGIPVFAPFTHLKSMDMSHPMHMGLLDYHQNPCSRLVSSESDVVLMLGGQLDFPLNYGEAPLLNSETTLITINSTARELSNNALADLRVCSGIKPFIQVLGTKFRGSAIDTTWVERIRDARIKSLEPYQECLENTQQPVHPLRLCHDVLMSLSEDDILVIDGGDIACWCEIALNAWAMTGRKIGGIFAPGPWEQMGTGPAFATAIKMEHPNSKVVLITGDGSLGLAPGLTPMETAIDQGIAVTLIVANNAQWGMIQEQQKEMWGRIYGSSLRDVDYYKIFDAAGAYSQLVTSPAEITDALNLAWQRNQPAFIEVKTSSIPSPMTQGLVEMRVKTAIE